jgi:hypothetical protein
MNLRKASIILLFIAIAILSLTAYYKLRTREQSPAIPTTQPTIIPTNNNTKFIGPNGAPHIKGPTAPPY